MKSLDELKVGQQAYLLPFDGRCFDQGQKNLIDCEALRCRLLELGLREGALIKVAYKAPFKNSPVAVYVADQLVSIGAAESCCVFVDLVEGS